MFLLGTLLNANAQVPSYVPKDSLKGWYPFNGNANDLSGNGNNGTVNGATLVNDRYSNTNSAYSFDGVTSHINVNKPPFINAPFTISVWINVTTLGVNTIVSLGELGSIPYQKLYLSPDYGAGTPSIGAAGTNDITSSTNAVTANNWTHLTLTVTNYSTNGVKFYVNGILLGANTKNGLDLSLPTNNSGFAIGKHSVQSGTLFFKGKIDELGLWNRILSSSEIKDLYIGCTKSITREPANQGMFTGNATFTCVTNDTLVNYQWQSDLGMGWTNLSNAGQYSGTTTNSLQVSNVTSSNNNQKFRCVLKGNCLTDTTNEATLRVWGLGIEGEIVDELIVYPNPSSTQVIIDNGNYSTMGSYNAKIINSIGQQVFQSVINQQQFIIDAKTMGGAGVYTLYITDANNKVVGVKKIVLQ